MSSVVENVVVSSVEKKVKAPKLQVKYERVYMTLFTVLNSFCAPPENEGDFVLKPEDMRKILEAVEFYSDDVKAQGDFIEENIFSKENIKSSRKLMKAERLQWKMDNGLIEKKKKRASRAKKAEGEGEVKAPREKKERAPREKKERAPRAKKGKETPVVVEEVPVVVEEETKAVEEVPVAVVEEETKVVKKKKVSNGAAPRKPKKTTELAEDVPLH